MPTGKIHKLVHLSQQTYQPNSKLIPGHNDKGYGTIDDGGGREVYFSHDVVPGIHGFDDLRRGQKVKYTLEEGPYLRAKRVGELATTVGNATRGRWLNAEKIDESI
jgi:cold shock CspA family protein